VQVLIARKDLKLVVMSATLDAVKFQKYFGNAPLVVRRLGSPLSQMSTRIVRKRRRRRRVLRAAESAWSHVSRGDILHPRAGA
jgi:hypothetical protein